MDIIPQISNEKGRETSEGYLVMKNLTVRRKSSSCTEKDLSGAYD